MTAACVLLAAMLFAIPAWAQNRWSPQAPVYSPASIVNSASNLSGPFAPNTIVSMYGSGLSNTTRPVMLEDIRGGIMPTSLAGVSVLVNNIPASLYFVSPFQVNLLIPNNMVPGPATVQLLLDGRAGPSISVTLRPSSPALFLLAPTIAIAVRPDGSLITPDSPAQPGGIITMYATGLGETSPALAPGELARSAVWLKNLGQFGVLWNGVEAPAANILYAGLAPGFAGLYQINLKLPDVLPDILEIRLVLGADESPPGITIPAGK